MYIKKAKKKLRKQSGKKCFEMKNFPKEFLHKNVILNDDGGK